MNLYKILLIALFVPIISCSQETKPRFENDTLYTSCGYKIHIGSVLTFGKGSGKLGHFRFVRIYTSDHNILTNRKVLVKKIDKFKMTDLGNEYIHIVGSVLYQDGTTDRADFAINFDKAIYNTDGFSPELIVPDEFKSKTKVKTAADKIDELKTMLQKNLITKQEYDSLRKNILNNL